MSLLWMDGFEGGGLLVDSDMRTYLGRTYSDSTAGSNDFNTTGRFGGTSWRARADAYIGVPVANKKTLIVGFAFQTSSTAGIDGEAFLVFLEGVNVQVKLVMKTGGEIAILRDTTQLAITSGLGMLAATWYHIEFKVTIDNTTGAYELRVNAQTEASGSAADTQTSSNAYADAVRLIGDDAAVIYTFDDFYILDDSGTFNNDFLGNMKIAAYFPNADGADTDFTPLSGNNYANVDDGRVTDDDTTYVQTVTNNAKDTLAYQTMADLANIAGVLIQTEARETDATNFTLAQVIVSGATTDVGDDNTLSSSYIVLSEMADVDPNTGSPWTLTALNSANFGYRANTV